MPKHLAATDTIITCFECDQKHDNSEIEFALNIPLCIDCAVNLTGSDA